MNQCITPEAIELLQPMLHAEIGQFLLGLFFVIIVARWLS